MFGGNLIGHNDPDYQEKIVKFNELLANCVMYSTACDITDAANDIAAEGERVNPRRPGHDLALHHPHRPPIRELDPQPHPALRRAHHPAGPRAQGAVRADPGRN